MNLCILDDFGTYICLDDWKHRKEIGVNHRPGSYVVFQPL